MRLCQKVCSESLRTCLDASNRPLGMLDTVDTLNNPSIHSGTGVDIFWRSEPRHRAIEAPSRRHRGTIESCHRACHRAIEAASRLKTRSVGIEPSSLGIEPSSLGVEPSSLAIEPSHRVQLGLCTTAARGQTTDKRLSHVPKGWIIPTSMNNICLAKSQCVASRRSDSSGVRVYLAES